MCALLLLAATTHTHAQSPQPEPATQPDPRVRPEQPKQPQQAAPAGPEQPTVVFFAPPTLAQTTRTALQDALSAQLSLVPARLFFTVPVESAADLDEHMQQAEGAAKEHAAAAAFWLDIPATGAWFVYAMDTRDGHVVLRRLQRGTESPEAAVESVAVVVRATVLALLQGAPIEAESRPPPPPAAPPAPKQLPPTQVVLATTATSALHLAAGYLGTLFAVNPTIWQSGVAVRADWLWPAGPFLGLGYTFLPTLRIHREVEFTIDRQPFALHAGLRFETGAMTFSAELAAEVERRGRRTLRAPGPAAASHKILYNVCPRLEAEYRLASWLRLYAGAGLDFVLSNFPYLINYHPDMDNQALVVQTAVLRPLEVRPTVQAGVAIVR